MAANEGFPERPILTGGEQLSERVQLSRGGGAPYSPQTFDQASARLAGMVTEARGVFAELPERLRANRILFEATVLPNYLANTHHPKALLEQIHAVAVGTRTARGRYVTKKEVKEDEPAKTLILSAADDSLEHLAEILGSGEWDLPNKVVDDVVKLQQIDAHPVERVLHLADERFIEIDGLVALEAVINPIVDERCLTDRDQLGEVLHKWNAYARELGGYADLEWARVHSKLTFLPTLLPRESLEQAARFNPLRAMRPMPRVAVEPLGPLRAIAGPRLLPPSTQPATDRRIAMFDGAVADTAPALAPYVTRHDLTAGAPNDAASATHATTVASAALYASIDTQSELRVPPAAVDAFRVWPPPEDQREDHHMYWVLDQIAAELKTNRHQIVSLSIGPEFTLEDDTEPHRWTVALDSLAVEHGIVICVAAGNTGEEDAESGANRICIPGDLINGLSVGACNALAPSSWRRAAYSSIGPGRPGAKVAPQILACGGELPASPYMCIVPGGQLAESYGTSLATPTLARAIAELAAALGEHVSANTLRACAIHFAESGPQGASIEHGYGRAPDSFLAQLECQPNEATILYQDVLQRGQTITLRLPLPEELLTELGKRSVGLRWTLAFASPVDPTDPVDYGCAGVTAYFRPHSETFNMNLDGQDPIKVNRLLDPNFFNQLIRAGRTPSDRPVTRTLKDYAPETERRADGKWETIVRIEDRMQATTLHRPAFDMHLLTRAGGDLTPADSPDALAYALVVTAIGPKDVALYDAVRATAPVLAPLGVPVELRVQT